MDVKKYLEDSFANQFEVVYGKKPTKEQTKAYMNFCLGKESDVKKILDQCKVEKLIERSVDRSQSKLHFSLIFGFEPNEEQLDVYISYHLKTIPNLEVIWELNKPKNKIGQTSESEPANN